MPTCGDGGRHYEVVSGVIAYPASQWSPADVGCCWGIYVARSQRDAIRQAVADPEFAEWVAEQRSLGSPPFKGLRAAVFSCPHGLCLGCDDWHCHECEWASSPRNVAMKELLELEALLSR